MKNVIIACETLRDELEKAIETTGNSYPIVWIESKYHIEPNELRHKLQQEIDSLENIDNILLAYGFCGNGTIGLIASTGNLIMPKTEDCISLLLTKSNKSFKRVKNTYFLTKGWMGSSKCIINEYQYTLKQYGEKRAERIFKLMLKNYKYLGLIDTGAYIIKEFKEDAEQFGKKVNLELIVEPGDTWFLNKLLTGPYDKDFFVASKGQEFKLNNLINNCTNTLQADRRASFEFL